MEASSCMHMTCVNSILCFSEAQKTKQKKNNKMKMRIKKSLLTRLNTLTCTDLLFAKQFILILLWINAISTKSIIINANC